MISGFARIRDVMPRFCYLEKEVCAPWLHASKLEHYDVTMARVVCIASTLTNRYNPWRVVRGIRVPARGQHRTCPDGGILPDKSGTVSCPNRQ